jgi:putative transposase
MACHTVEHQGARIRLACQTLGISQTCYRYQATLSPENVEIAVPLVHLTHNQRNWEFGLCFYLCNAKGYVWNHKRVYRIYCGAAPAGST